jgi:hypothetical protein
VYRTLHRSYGAGAARNAGGASTNNGSFLTGVDFEETAEDQPGDAGAGASAPDNPLAVAIVGGTPGHCDTARGGVQSGADGSGLVATDVARSSDGDATLGDAAGQAVAGADFESLSWPQKQRVIKRLFHKITENSKDARAVANLLKLKVVHSKMSSYKAPRFMGGAGVEDGGSPGGRKTARQHKTRKGALDNSLPKSATTPRESGFEKSHRELQAAFAMMGLGGAMAGGGGQSDAGVGKENTAHTS